MWIDYYLLLYFIERLLSIFKDTHFVFFTSLVNYIHKHSIKLYRLTIFGGVVFAEIKKECR